ncbi:DUF1835 domain-containing protein [Bacillus sp. FJAT-27445]|uniref:DUF1835 domain-containing protein n=1 Tax=Bacillus sp. FJAT-27445 TaxID=1679166 RepID=UPI00074417A1|nr:DUF1835 domain-containing protein [Bacillus sp. FJAT-27445]
MINELKRLVNNCSEEEAKSLLFLILLRIEMAEETGTSDVQLSKDIREIYSDFMKNNAGQPNIGGIQNPSIIHIVFGETTLHMLKHVLKTEGLAEKEQVIGFPDLFAIGPLSRLDEEAGLGHRHEWIKNHIHYDEDYLDEYKVKMKTAIETVIAIPENIPIHIWCGENAHEQTAASFAMHLLSGKKNDVSVFNTTASFKEKFNTAEIQYHPLHTGELHPEKLWFIFEENRNRIPLTREDRLKLESEWVEISAGNAVLRIWDAGKVRNIEEDYFDQNLIDIAKRLHKKQKNKDFLMAARIIGEAIGQIEQYVGDSYLEYRLRHLIAAGIFEVRGTTKALRYYSVKLS